MHGFNRLQQIGAYVILLVYSLITAVPLVIMFFNGFKPMRDIFLEPFSFPWPPHYENFINAWNRASFSRYIGNSVIVSLSSVLLILLVASMAAYVLARFKFPLRRFIYLYIISGLVLPARLAIIPLFLLLRDLGLLDTHIALILVYSATGLPFSMFLLVNFVQSIPWEIEESARLDGANPLQIYGFIMLPLLRPALATVGIFNFVNVWNDFFFPLIIIRSDSRATIPLGISNFFGEYSVQWDLLFAGLNIAIIPILLLFIVASKQFMGGLTQGAIK